MLMQADPRPHRRTRGAQKVKSQPHQSRDLEDVGEDGAGAGSKQDPD